MMYRPPEELTEARSRNQIFGYRDGATWKFKIEEVERVAVEETSEVDPATFEAVLQEAREAHDRVQEAAYHELHREPFRAEMADEILARVPPAAVSRLCRQRSPSKFIA